MSAGLGNRRDWRDFLLTIAQRQPTCFSPNSPRFDSQWSQKNLRGNVINVAEVNQWRWSVKSGHLLGNVDLVLFWLVLASQHNKKVIYTLPWMVIWKRLLPADVSGFAGHLFQVGEEVQAVVVLEQWQREVGLAYLDHSGLVREALELAGTQLN